MTCYVSAASVLAGRDPQVDLLDDTMWLIPAIRLAETQHSAGGQVWFRQTNGVGNISVSFTTAPSAFPGCRESPAVQRNSGRKTSGRNFLMKL